MVKALLVFCKIFWQQVRPAMLVMEVEMLLGKSVTRAVEQEEWKNQMDTLSPVLIVKVLELKLEKLIRIIQ
jgi:hypothetical protein